MQSNTCVSGTLLCVDFPKEDRTRNSFEKGFFHSFASSINFTPFSAKRRMRCGTKRHGNEKHQHFRAVYIQSKRAERMKTQGRSWCGTLEVEIRLSADKIFSFYFSDLSLSNLKRTH